MKICNSKILLIIPWYGKIPGYLDLFCRSISHSKLVDVLFVTDLDFSDLSKKSSNIRSIHITAHDFEARVEKLTGFRPVLQGNALKLCDLKPLYGSLFREQCAGYNYWAFGDCDLVYGDIDDFLNKINYSRYDIVSFRKFWVTGSLTLVRNTAKCTELWRTNPTEGKIITTWELLCADEVGPNWDKLLKRVPLEAIPMDFVPFTSLVIAHPELKWYHEDVICEKLQPGEILHVSLNGGGIVNLRNKRSEFCFHYVLHKHSHLFNFPKNFQSLPSVFYIDETGFYNSLRFYGCITTWRRISHFIWRAIRKLLKMIA